MIVRWPSQVPSGRVSETPWYFPDVLPTLAELAGASMPGNVDGISVLPTLMGQSQDLDHRYMYWERPPGKFQQAARFGRWKALRLGRNQPLKLFHVVADTPESLNLAAQNPDWIARFCVARALQELCCEPGMRTPGMDLLRERRPRSWRRLLRDQLPSLSPQVFACRTHPTSHPRSITRCINQTS